MTFVPKELRFNVPWGVLAAKAWGPSEGKPVLCLHGWLDNANTFDRLIPLLPQDHYYVALDFSGHGESSHIPKGMRYQHLDYVSDIHRVVTSLGWRRFSIIGHSMGGVVGLKYSSIFPETVQHLTLLDCYGFFPISIDILLSHMRRAVTQYSRFEGANGAKVYTVEEALQRLLNGNQSLNSDTAKVLLQRGTKPVPGGVIFSRDIRITMINSVPITLEQALYVMKSLQCDVHVILANEGPAADSERGVSTDEAQSILTGFKENLKERFQYTVVDGNHFVHLNKPERIAKFIVNQLYGRPSIHSRL